MLLNDYLDISAEVLEDLLRDGAHHRLNIDAKSTYVVYLDPGIPKSAEIVDVTWDAANRRIRLHFEQPIPEPTMHRLEVPRAG